MGFVKLDNMRVATLITWISPEIIMLLTSIITLVVCKKMVSPNPALQTNEEGEVIQKLPKKKKYGFLVTIGKYYNIKYHRINKKINNF